MRWGSFDPFLLGDAFWQDRMGMPVANKEFLRALLQYGTFESYTFFCADSSQLVEFQKILPEIVPAECHKRVRLSLQVFFKDESRKAPIDIMHNGDFTYFMPYLIEFRNRSASFPFPISGVTHSLDTVSLYGKFIHLLLAKPQSFDTIVCTSRCAVEMLTATFEHIRESFASSFGAKLPEPPSFTQIPLGIPEEAFAAQDRYQCRKALNIPNHHFVMLSLARFSPRRKMDLAPLLECIEWLQSRTERPFPESTLILAGAGKTNDLKLVQDMIIKLRLQDRVRIESNVTSEKKMLLLGAADVFLSMVDNYQETFGITIIEAMAQGLPVVASDFNGYKDLVIHKRTGFLIPTYMSMDQEPWDSLGGLLDSSVLRFYRAQKIAFDFCELAEALYALATDTALRQEMSLRARARALPFQWRWIIGLYEELWKKRKEEAAQFVGQPEASGSLPPLIAPSTQRSFSHYPSMQLSPQTRLALSNYGKRCVQRSFQPILYEEMAVVLNKECQDYLIARFLERTWTIGEMLEECRQHSGLSKEFVLLNLDWLLKHGYIAILENCQD